MKKFLLGILENLKWAIAGKEMQELYHWRSQWEDYRRWLAEFPEIAITLDNFKNSINGTISMDACHPPGISGPWTVSSLREHLRSISKFESNEHVNQALNELINHYCGLLDNLGDTPIPDFENWAEKQYKKGTDILDRGHYFRNKFYIITLRNK